MDITTIGFDLAKTVFQVHGADGEGRPVVPPIYLIRGASRTPTGPPALVMAPSSL